MITPNSAATPASAMNPTAPGDRQVVAEQIQQPDAADQREGQGDHDQQRLVEALEAQVQQHEDDQQRERHDHLQLRGGALQELELPRPGDRSACCSPFSGAALVKSLLSQAAEGHLTPILGSGLTDALVGTRRKMALSFAEEFDFPLAEHLRDDLPQVAQYVLSTAGSLTMRERLRSHLDKQLRATLGSLTLPQSDDLDASVRRRVGCA